MQGTMLWFNREKGCGFIRTEHEERIEVARSGFLPGNKPESRCKGLRVSFDRQVDGESVRAVNVTFVVASEPRRARLRHARGGVSL